jgi:pimeloyl-ACP methyl ester carboxylesterase
MGAAAAGYAVRSLEAEGGVRLALHGWAAARPLAAIFYIHGIQSHAGWLHETAAALTERRVSLYALDRRGSGRSEGERGHLESVETLLGDYSLALGAVRSDVGDVRLLALGQSLGGSVLAGLWVRDALAVDGLVFCAPALGQQRSRHGAERLAELRGLRGTERRPVALEDGDYTSEARYLGFIARDPLMLREVTDQTRATLVRLEDLYMAAREPRPPPGRVFLALPRTDPIVDLDSARSVLGALAPGFGEREFAGDRHYIEFSPARAEYWDWLAERALGGDAT